MMGFAEEERPLSIQIYGSKAERMADAAQLVQDIGADIVDINMGCPANKVLKGCAGCSLMGDLNNAQEIIRTVRKRVQIPLTVKFRLGLRDTALNFLELGHICQEEGVNAVALHARTAKQMFSGHSDWQRIAELKNALKIPVMGNGDVNTPADAVTMFAQTGCDGVMVGRASMKNPWVFRRLRRRWPSQPVHEPTAVGDATDPASLSVAVASEDERPPSTRSARSPAGTRTAFRWPQPAPAHQQHPRRAGFMAEIMRSSRSC
jgi:nifR3 family TIM-barrel protein